MSYIHVSFENVDEFTPRVPLERADGEDATIPRICVTKDVISSLNAIPAAGNVFGYKDGTGSLLCCKQEKNMRKGEHVYTPRFCTVQIEEVFENREEAEKAGYTEPTFYEGEFGVLGKSLDMYHMEFAAYK